MKLEILIGMIASGKTTYARRRADDGALIICHDDLTQMLHGRYHYEADLRDLYGRVMRQIAVEAFRQGRSVVVDRTHLTRESRAAWVDLARSWELWRNRAGKRLRIVAVAFPIRSAEVHAERRSLADGRGRSHRDWLHVAKHHYRQAEAEPLDWKAEGFDDHVWVGTVADQVALAAAACDKLPPAG